MKDVITGMLIAGLSGDILFLYFAGGWAEPIRWIEITELILLFCFFVGGLAYAVRGFVESLT